MKPQVIATLIVRGHGLAMVVVGAIRAFDLLYALFDPVFAPRTEAPGALRYALAVVAFDFGLAFLLFVLSRWIGRLFLLDLEGSEV